MNRRTLLRGAAVVALSSCASPQPAAKRIPVVGFFPHDLTRNVEQRAAFLDELRKFGYEDGRTLKLEWVMTEETDDAVDRVARDLVALPVDVLVTNGGPSARAARRATGTVPIVFLAPDPVETGLVKSLPRPGGNLTGVARLSNALTAKRLELLRQAAPSTSKVAIIVGDDPDRRLSQTAADEAARALGLAALIFEVHDRFDLARALTRATTFGADALLSLGIIGVEPKDDDTLPYAATRRLPTSYATARWVDAGGLMCYGPNSPANFRRAGNFVARILGGAKPADMPIESPTEFDLVINLKTARTIGLTLPQSLLSQATRVIE